MNNLPISLEEIQRLKSEEELNEVLSHLNIISDEITQTPAAATEKTFDDGKFEKIFEQIKFLTNKNYKNLLGIIENTSIVSTIEQEILDENTVDIENSVTLEVTTVPVQNMFPQGENVVNTEVTTLLQSSIEAGLEAIELPNILELEIESQNSANNNDNNDSEESAVPILNSEISSTSETLQNSTAISCIKKNSDCSLCSEEEICYHCKNKLNLENIRAQCHQAQKRQGNKMLQKSNKKFKPGNVGMTVRVPIPDVDRSRSDHRNILAVIMDIEENFYRLGTVHGVLKQLYSRNEFEICKQSFLTINDVPKDVEMTLRSVAGKCSLSQTTQGYVRCQCTKGCKNKKCKCISNGYTCNSKCHNSLSCSNK